LQTNTSHIVIGDFNNFLQTEHARLRRMGQLFKWDLFKKKDVWNITKFIPEAQKLSVIITWHKARTKSTIAFRPTG
jgi:hypothetical protein